MRVQLENVGLWRSAGMTIDGITIIAGENGTGKSTFGKALFGVFNTLNRLDNRVRVAKNTFVERVIRDIFQNDAAGERRLAYKQFLSDVKLETLWDSDLALVLKNIDYLSDDIKNELTDRLAKAKRLSDVQIGNVLMTASLSREFDDQVQNIGSRKNKDKAAIKLMVANELTEAHIQDEMVVDIINRRSLEVQPIYIDDVALLAALLSGASSYQGAVRKMFPGHVEEMARLVRGYSVASSGSVEENVISSLIQAQSYAPIRKRLETLCHGYLKATNDGFKMMDAEDASVQYSLSNVAAGLKTFLILEDLVLNQTIKEKGLVILDEPETHLHPEWQLILAELVVLLQKTFKLHVLIASHSPYFISALDAYSKKYQVVEHNHYYFAERNGGELVLTDVTKRIAKIYNSLARPYQTVEDVERSMDGRKCS